MIFETKNIYVGSFYDILASANTINELISMYNSDTFNDHGYTVTNNIRKWIVSDIEQSKRIVANTRVVELDHDCLYGLDFDPVDRQNPRIDRLEFVVGDIDKFREVAQEHFLSDSQIYVTFAMIKLDHTRGRFKIDCSDNDVLYGFDIDDQTKLVEFKGLCPYTPNQRRYLEYKKLFVNDQKYLQRVFSDYDQQNFAQLAYKNYIFNFRKLYGRPMCRSNDRYIIVNTKKIDDYTFIDYFTSDSLSDININSNTIVVDNI